MLSDYGNFLIDEIYRNQVYDFYWSPRMGNVVIDVGAHIGIFTLKSSKLVGEKGIVIAIEPDPNNYRMLLNNTSLIL